MSDLVWRDGAKEKPNALRFPGVIAMRAASGEIMPLAESEIDEKYYWIYPYELDGHIAEPPKPKPEIDREKLEEWLSREMRYLTSCGVLSVIDAGRFDKTEESNG